LLCKKANTLETQYFGKVKTLLPNKNLSTFGTEVSTSDKIYNTQEQALVKDL